MPGRLGRRNPFFAGDIKSLGVGHDIPAIGFAHYRLTRRIETLALERPYR